MEFSKVIGVDADIALQVQNKLSGVIAAFSCRKSVSPFNSGLAGDHVTFATMYLSDHICTNEVHSVGTNGKEYFWNPEFVLNTSTLKLRFICQHMSQHSALLSTEVLKDKNQTIFNIAVDFAANGYIMKDLKEKLGTKVFEKSFITNLGEYVITDELIDANSSFLLHTKCYADPIYDGFSASDIYDNLMQVLPTENYNCGKLIDEHFYIDENLDSISNRTAEIIKFIHLMEDNEFNWTDVKNSLFEKDYDHLVPVLNKLFDGKNIINEFDSFNKFDRFVFCLLSCMRLSEQLDKVNPDDISYPIKQELLPKSVSYIYDFLNTVSYEYVIFPVRSKITIDRLIKFDLDNVWFDIISKKSLDF